MNSCLHCGRRALRPGTYEFTERLAGCIFEGVIRDLPQCAGCGEWYFTRTVVLAIDTLLAWHLARAGVRSREARALIRRVLAMGGAQTSGRAARAKADAQVPRLLEQRVRLLDTKRVKVVSVRPSRQAAR